MVRVEDKTRRRSKLYVEFGERVLAKMPGDEQAAILRAIGRVRKIRTIGEASAWELLVKLAVYMADGPEGTDRLLPGRLISGE